MRIRAGRRGGRQVRVGASDPAVTPVAGLVAVRELCDRLRLIGSIDQAAGPIKQRARGHGLGALLVGMAAAQFAGEDFLVGLDRQRADAAGQLLAPVSRLAASTAVGLARRVTPGKWGAVQTEMAEMAEEWLRIITRTVREFTHYSYARNLRLHVEPYIGSAPVASADGGTLNALYARLLAEGSKHNRSDQAPGLSPRSVRYVHVIVRRMFKDAGKWGRLARNAADPPRATSAGAPEIEPWTAEGATYVPA